MYLFKIFTVSGLHPIPAERLRAVFVLTPTKCAGTHCKLVLFIHRSFVVAEVFRHYSLSMSFCNTTLQYVQYCYSYVLVRWQNQYNTCTILVVYAVLTAIVLVHSYRYGTVDYCSR